jgi:hypothetical protein
MMVKMEIFIILALKKQNLRNSIIIIMAHNLFRFAGSIMIIRPALAEPNFHNPE